MAFHVPEANRVRSGTMGTTALDDGDNGAFVLKSPQPDWLLLVIACDGTVLPEDDPELKVAEDWEHVSVHAATRAGEQRTPTWDEMCFVKAQFWDAEDVVMQLHPRQSGYVNLHPHVLHLWRHRAVPIPEPPLVLV